jgi:hypothetical protein
MKRDYETGEADNVIFFVGDEVEKTPAYGMKTLFVTGIQPVETIEKHYNDNDCEHIFFGANHSFKPNESGPKSLFDSWKEWEDMIEYFLYKDILCTLDIPLDHVANFHDGGLCEKDNFIPQIRVPLPYTKLWNYNTMIKIDDVDFKATNPGVWCHSLHDLMDREKFTDWSKYGLDKVIK